MAQINYAKSAATAQRLLAKFGRTVTIKRQVPGSTAPPYAAHSPGPPTWITYTAAAACLPASKGTIEAFDNRLESGSLIDEKLRYVIMSPKLVRTSETGPETIEPRSLDVLAFDDFDWTVLGCTPLNPAGISVLFKLGVKR